MSSLRSNERSFQKDETGNLLEPGFPLARVPVLLVDRVPLLLPGVEPLLRVRELDFFDLEGELDFRFCTMTLINGQRRFQNHNCNLLPISHSGFHLKVDRLLQANYSTNGLSNRKWSSYKESSLEQT